MSKIFIGPSARIEVAVALGASGDTVLTAAVELARRCGATLRVIHVVEPHVLGAPPFLVDAIGMLRDFSQSVDDETERQALRTLRAMTRDLAPRVPVETVVRSGAVAETILADATEHDARLVVIGAGASLDGRAPRATSTTFRLIAETSLPMLVVRAGADPDLATRHLRMLIADDLSAPGEHNVLVGLDLARALGHTDVLHLHVNTLTERALRAAAALSLTDGGNGAIAADVAQIVATAQARLETALADRSPERRPLLEARGCSYRSEVVGGEVATEIERAARAFEADVLVFGRHRAWHRHPLGLGHVTHAAMLAHGGLVVIVPPMDRP